MMFYVTENIFVRDGEVTRFFPYMYVIGEEAQGVGDRRRGQGWQTNLWLYAW
ncbi:hypothetical protein [Vulcanisaeta souniana]|uniref:hypothetical protein n=1 Tax=Vulcanisaeta souniana TaxID=164452 RepID=UPI001663BF2C|nr:hypothetical protein [Vulcanisaeta souniana]